MPRFPAVPRTMHQCSLPLLAGLLGLALAGSAYALEFGHARVLSGVGQPLRADIAIVQLSAQELADLQVRVAPDAAWRQAGLTPPVDVSSLQVHVVDGLTSDTRIARLTSVQVFAGTVADFLVDVQTAASVQRHQVSVLVQRRALAVADGADVAPSGGSPASVTVRRGDTLFFVAHQHAVSGFSDYQMMAALFYANPSAFIDDNMNLVRAGAVLRLPDAATLSRLTDRQARLLFVQHARAYALRRGRSVAAGVLENAVGLTPPVEDETLSESTQAHVAEAPSSQDQLQLRVDDIVAQRAGGSAALGDAGPLATETSATRSAVQDSLTRIAQLEDDIQDLNQVLQEMESLPGAQASAVSPDARAARASLITDIAPGENAVPRSDTQTADAMASLVSGAVQGDALRASTASAARQSDAEASTSAVQQNAVLAAPESQASAANHAVTPGVLTPGVSNAASTPQTPSQTPTPGGGLTSKLWMMIAAAAALLILLLVWLLRRTRVAQNAGGQITDAMIQEKLNTIDLDLRLDQDDSPRHRR